MSGLTVAVCTRDRPQQLARALASVMEQSPGPAEVVVVDNAPTEDTTRKLIQDRFPGVRYVREPIPGLDFARNRALSEATQEVVAFLDDDAVAAPGWSAAIHRAFRSDPQVMICTGRVEPLSLETAGQRLFEANGGFSRGTERIRLPEDAARRLHGLPAPLIAWAMSVGCGCSYAVRRDAARALGGFDPALGAGTICRGGDDLDLLWRALQEGRAVVYEPAALAWHEHRRELRAAHDQIVAHQRGVLAFLSKHLVSGDGRARGSLLGYSAWRLVKPGVRLVRRALGQDPLPVAVLLRMWWNCWAGLAAYPQAKKLARARREEHSA
jgi:glycosyltransferase involved in cell wall biosynthesis